LKMSLTKEDVEKTVLDFHRIAVRSDRKPATSSTKIFLIATCIVIVAIAVLGYYYWQKKKSPGPNAANASPKVDLSPSTLLPVEIK